MQGWGSVDGIDGHIPEAELAWKSWYQSTSMDMYIYIYVYLWRVVAYYALRIFRIYHLSIYIIYIRCMDIIYSIYIYRFYDPYIICDIAYIMNTVFHVSHVFEISDYIMMLSHQARRNVSY